MRMCTRVCKPATVHTAASHDSGSQPTFRWCPTVPNSWCACCNTPAATHPVSAKQDTHQTRRKLPVMRVMSVPAMATALMQYRLSTEPKPQSASLHTAGSHSRPQSAQQLTLQQLTVRLIAAARSPKRNTIHSCSAPGRSSTAPCISVLFTWRPWVVAGRRQPPSRGHARMAPASPTGRQQHGTPR